jgi:hypothetical protein
MPYLTGVSSVLEEALAAAEQDRDDREVHLVDQAAYPSSEIEKLCTRSFGIAAFSRAPGNVDVRPFSSTS